jgi:hypothetical protein
MYFVFGFLLGPPKTEEQRKLVGFGSAAAIACIGVVVVLFEWPYSGYKVEPVVVLSEAGSEKPAEQNESLGGFEVRIGTMGAKNGVQTWSSTSARGGARVSTHNILLICQHPHRLLDRTTREFQKSLVQLPYVDKVTYYPFGTWPKPGELLPDIFVTINMPEVNENNFICGRKLKLAITWKAGSMMLAGPSHSVHAYTPPLVKFDIEGRLDHESKMMGFESPMAKYKLEASNISREMIKSISKEFESLLDKHNRLPDLPEMLHGTYHKPPEFPFLKDDMAEQLISGRGLFKNNHTVWRFTDEREIDEALTAYRDELKTLGWAVEDSSKGYLRMQKDSEYIYIFRQRRHDPEARAITYGNREKQVSQVPMIAHYESYLTNDQMQRAMDVLLDSDVDMKTLLVFEKYFRTSEQRERLRSIIEQSPVHTLDGCLVLARYWMDRGELDKARELLLRARAMQRAEKEHNVKAQEIKSLAKKLGDEGLADVPIDERILHDLGFVNVEQLTEPLEIKRALDEPVLFSRRLDSGELRTFALRVIRSREPLSPVPYRLLTVEKSKGSSRSSETGGRIESDGIWVAESNLYDLAGENKSPQLKIECLGNEHFLFAVIP